MTKPAITRLSGLEVNSSSTNNENGLYVPQLTTPEIAAIPSPQDGGIVFNTTTNAFNGYNGGWGIFGGGAGNVTGPGGSVVGDIPIFGNITGTILTDSGIKITVDPALYIPSVAAPAVPLVANDGILFVNGGRILFESGTVISTGTIPAFSTATSTIGTATLLGGTATIATTAVTAQSTIFLTNTTVGANTAPIAVTAQTPNVSFVVTSFNVADTNTFNWMIINAA